METDPILITGEVDSGKTRFLYTVCSRLDLAGFSFCGMIQVPSLPGKTKDAYVWSDQGSGETRTLLRVERQAGWQRFGRFWYDQDAFDWARECIMSRLAISDYLTFDEIGPMELEGKALDETIKESLAKFKGTVIAAVRSSLLDEVCERYALHTPEQRILRTDLPWDAQLERLGL